MNQVNGSRLLLQPNADNSGVMPAPLNEHAEKIKNSLVADSDKMFQYAEARLAAVRHVCDVAEEILRQKRETLNAGFTDFVQALQAIETETKLAEGSVSNLMLQADKL